MINLFLLLIAVEGSVTHIRARSVSTGGNYIPRQQGIGTPVIAGGPIPRIYEKVGNLT